MTRVCILGAGVGGLVAAHELIKKGYQVDIYERNNVVGGQSRSSERPDGGHTEYCWHVVGRSYLHLYPILQEIPSGNRTVADSLKPMDQFFYFRENGHRWYERGNSFLTRKSLRGIQQGIRNAGGQVTFKDLRILIKAWLVANTNSNRQLSRYDRIKWEDYMSELSDEMKKWVVDAPSIYLGMETNRLSTHTMLNLLKGRRDIEGMSIDFYSFNGPISEVWFEPWVKYLKEQGVNFYFNSEVQSINIKGRWIESVTVKNNYKTYDITADHYVNGLGIETLSRVVSVQHPEKTNWIHLAAKGKQLQTQVLYYLDKRLDLDTGTILIFPDTPWCIMIRPEAVLWGLWNQDLLSAGVGIWHREGINGKTAKDCTPDEIAEEVWNQLGNYGGSFFEHFVLDKQIPEYDIWHSYTYDTFRKEIVTWEPKFSNNVDTLAFRPNIDDSWCHNFKHATAYAKTDMNVFCMESAAEAARRAVLSITTGNSRNDRPKFK